jgi:DNA-binding GntR family transcriptional regulator
LEEKLVKITYQEQAYSVLEKMIVSGKLQPREKLVESELAASLGVSRSPVREALIQLEQERLVMKTSKGAWIVSEISLRDIMELYDLRKLIEAYAGKKGCVACSEDIIAEMKVNIKQFETQHENVEAWGETNRRFHELIVLSCGNNQMHEVFMRLIKSLRWCTHLALSVLGRQDQSISEHKEILEAFLEQDQELVQKVICKHIETVRKNIKSQGMQTSFVRQDRG